MTHRQWCTEVGLAKQDDGSIEVAVANYHWLLPSYIGPEPDAPPPSSPGLVITLLNHDKWSGRLGSILLSPNPHALQVGDLAMLRDALIDPQRECPLVVIRSDRFLGRPLLDPQTLARVLAGIAVVYEGQSEELDAEFEFILPREYRCTSGMIRVYLPGLNVDAPWDSRRHRFFIPTDIKSLGPQVVQELIVDGLARRFASSTAPSVGSIDDVDDIERRAQLQQLLQSAKAGDKDQAFLDYCDSEVKRLSERVDALEKERDRANEQVNTLDNQLRTEQYLRSEMERQARAAVKDQELTEALKQLVANRGLPMTSLSEVVEAIATMFPHRIVITEQARDSAARAGFNELEDEIPTAFRMLWHLATTMHDLVFQKDGRSGQIGDEFRSRTNGLDIAMAEGKMTNRDKTAKDLRTIKFEGVELDISPHLKHGNDQDTCLRIHFASHRRSDDDGVIVVGHCGDHLLSAGTRKARKR
ncbi:MAG: hypothetical protein KF708_06895 [Pirellulales bacterium]|nr:hypothetical protein [Pirellulales bacterium]